MFSELNSEQSDAADAEEDSFYIIRTMSSNLISCTFNFNHMYINTKLKLLSLNELRPHTQARQHKNVDSPQFGISHQLNAHMATWCFGWYWMLRVDNVFKAIELDVFMCGICRNYVH